MPMKKASGPVTSSNRKTQHDSMQLLSKREIAAKAGLSVSEVGRAQNFGNFTPDFIASADSLGPMYLFLPSRVASVGRLFQCTPPRILLTASELSSALKLGKNSGLELVAAGELNPDFIAQPHSKRQIYLFKKSRVSEIAKLPAVIERLRRRRAVSQNNNQHT